MSIPLYFSQLIDTVTDLDIDTKAVRSTGRDSSAASSCHLAVKLVEFLRFMSNAIL